MSYLTQWALSGVIALGADAPPESDFHQIALNTSAAVELCQALQTDDDFSMPVLVRSSSGQATIEHIHSNDLLKPGVVNYQFGVVQPIGWPANPAAIDPVLIFDIRRISKISAGGEDGELVPGTDVVLNQPMANGRLTSVDALGQFEQWWFGKNCDVQRHHRMIRSDGADMAMLSFDANDAAIDVQLLNPPVPETDELAKQEHSKLIKVAMVDAGVNYLLPQIYKRLARSSDGKMLGYDFWDMDVRPFDAHPAKSPFYVQRHGTATASLLLAEAEFVELVPYRYPRGNMQRMRKLIEHASETGVRLIGLPLGGGQEDQWQTFDEVAREHPEMLFVVSAGNNGRNIDQQPIYPAALKLPNMIVVTSVDDFGSPAEGVNYGFDSVEYLLPAERQWVLQFDGTYSQVSGSSYAVPRFLAMAAKFLQKDPEQSTEELIKSIERRFADGLAVKYVNKGYISDPLAVSDPDIDVLTDEMWTSSIDAESVDDDALNLPLDALILADGWSDRRVKQTLQLAASILTQCGIVISDVSIKRVNAPDYLKDLSGNESRTLMTALRRTGQYRRVTLVFARDTKMQAQFEGEAFGRGNTRNRPWLQDSVWLLETIADDGLALAHELFHVLANSGVHVQKAGNLMNSDTSTINTSLLPGQCAAAREVSINNKLVKPISRP